MICCEIVQRENGRRGSIKDGEHGSRAISCTLNNELDDITMASLWGFQGPFWAPFKSASMVPQNDRTFRSLSLSLSGLLSLGHARERPKVSHSRLHGKRPCQQQPQHPPEVKKKKNWKKENNTPSIMKINNHITPQRAMRVSGIGLHRVWLSSQSVGLPHRRCGENLQTSGREPEKQTNARSLAEVRARASRRLKPSRDLRNN